MRFESGLEFGRNAATINEAYAKMINEAAEPQKGDSDYTEEKDWKKDVSASDLGDLMSGFSSGHSKYDKRKVIPDWLRAEAERHGHKFTDEQLAATVGDEDSNVQVKNDVEDIEDVEADSTQETDDLLTSSNTEDTVDNVESEEDTDEDGAISAEEDFYNKTILANPEWFNSDEYDMDAIAAHKKELLDKSVEFMMNGYAPVKAAAEALEEIPGCECKKSDTSDDVNTDSDVADSTEDEELDSVGNIDDTINIERDGSLPSDMVDGFENDSDEDSVIEKDED